MAEVGFHGDSSEALGSVTSYFCSGQINSLGNMLY